MSGRKEIKCEDVGCRLKGYWIKSEPSGEKLIHNNANQGRESHVATFKLAETTVRMIRRDKRFAECFRGLLEG